MDRRWLRVTLALELIIVAQWPSVVLFANKFKDVQRTDQY